MAGTGAKLFVSGDVLTAAQVNTYLMDQSVMRFADTTARDTAFGGVGEPVLAEGMFAYTDDTNTLWAYDGSAWTEAVNTASLADNAVTQAKVADRAIGSAELDSITYNAQVGTTYTLVLTDAQKIVSLTNGSAIALTVPTNASVAFETGDQINLLQLGAGQVTVAGDAGVTVSSEGAKLKLKDQYAIGTLVKTGTDAWVLVGNLGA